MKNDKCIRCKRKIETIFNFELKEFICHRCNYLLRKNYSLEERLLAYCNKNNI